MIIEYESQNSGRHVVIDKIYLKKSKKGFFTCKLIQKTMDDKQIETKEIEHAAGKGFSEPEAFLAALDDIGNNKDKKDV